MEPDFSIRKEVEAIQNDQDRFGYEPPPESPFDQFIQNDDHFRPNSPAPSQGPGYGSHRLILQQQELIHQQQMFGFAMAREMARQKTEPWKYLAIISVCTLIYLLIFRNKNSTREIARRPRRSRRKNVAAKPVAVNKFDA